MKIKAEPRSYKDVLALPKPPRFLPKRPNLLFRSLVRLLAIGDLKATNFTYTTRRMEEVGDEPCLILMNHSSFIDLEIVSKIFYPKPYGIVCTSDGFVGKKGLMRNLGCIPTKKFVSDVGLIGDMTYMLHDLKTSVLMYPEASYTFDGCATPLPRHLGLLLKKLDVPVVLIKTEGAFARDPLYNCLQKRKVSVSAEVSFLLNREEIAEKSVEELDGILNKSFTFDNFRWQEENRVKIDEPFRADGLDRILYKCAHCGAEGEMEGKGALLTCHHCGKQWELGIYGALSALDGETEFSHIPDWYNWERSEVRQELENGTYALETDVSIGVLVDYKALYLVGDGHLSHNASGFVLDGCDGALHYEQKPLASYSLYSDYFWYERGDVICIGNQERLYYCFPKGPVPVAKTRMAAEELYKLKHRRRKPTTEE